MPPDLSTFKKNQISQNITIFSTSDLHSFSLPIWKYAQNETLSDDATFE